MATTRSQQDKGVQDRGAEAEADDLRDQAAPLAEPDKTKVAPGAIKLPPEELRDQLDNDGADDAPDEEPEVATLDFYADGEDELPEWTHPLRFKFKWQGAKVEAINVRQLTVAEVGKVYAAARRAKRVPELFDFYAAMTGFPPPVLRALKAVDGGPVTDKCWDFLPPSVRPDTG